MKCRYSWKEPEQKCRKRATAFLQTDHHFSFSLNQIYPIVLQHCATYFHQFSGCILQCFPVSNQPQGLVFFQSLKAKWLFWQSKIGHKYFAMFTKSNKSQNFFFLKSQGKMAVLTRRFGHLFTSCLVQSFLLETETILVPSCYC